MSTTSLRRFSRFCKLLHGIYVSATLLNFCIARHVNCNIWAGKRNRIRHRIPKCNYANTGVYNSINLFDSGIREKVRATIANPMVWMKRNWTKNRVHMLWILITWGVAHTSDNIFIALMLDHSTAIFFYQVFFYFFFKLIFYSSFSSVDCTQFFLFIFVHLEFFACSLFNWNISMDISPNDILLFLIAWQAFTSIKNMSDQTI